MGTRGGGDRYLGVTDGGGACAARLLKRASVVAASLAAELG